MQGLESLNKFQNFMSSVGGLGRFEDTYMVHAAEGETVVPMEVLNRNPVLKERLFETMRDMGIQPERYIVGNEFNSINPLTGQPEFFLKWLGKRLKKGVRDIGSRLRKGAADISGYAAPIIGAMYGPGAGAAVGALLGQYKRENPGDPSQWGQMALRGGIAGLGANIASGQGLTLGGGMRGIYNPIGEGTSFLQSMNPMTIGKAFLDKPTKMFWDPKKEGLDKLRFMKNLTGGATPGKEMVNLTGKLKGFNIPTEMMNKSLGESVPFLEKLLGKNTVAGLVLKFGMSKFLGDVIKEENEEAAREARRIADEYGERTVFSQFPSLTQPGELVAPPDTALTDVYAAKGGIIGYHGGGFTGSPHTEGAFYKGEDEGDVMPKGVQDELLRYLFQKYMQEQEHMKERMEDRYNQPPPSTLEAANGGILDLQGGGESQGPGTGTSDSIPAMLSDGEFVMTADAVRGAGGGNRREGARRMYQMMDSLERSA